MPKISKIKRLSLVPILLSVILAVGISLFQNILISEIMILKQFKLKFKANFLNLIVNRQHLKYV
ncbi:hypothetical protein [Methanobrevibacter filiformis]|uniref:hypothetical protein n=1 Tax=Methanobrevibacter filiformis TaxID=55758 RepID=UPI00083387FC|nr:hypothetical protein [Methanobrevibacter filiformis]